MTSRRDVIKAGAMDPVTLVALFQQSRLSRIANYQPADRGFQEIV